MSVAVSAFVCACVRQACAACPGVAALGSHLTGMCAIITCVSTDGVVTCLAFLHPRGTSPRDGGGASHVLLAAGLSTGLVYVWDTCTGEIVGGGPLECSREGITSVACVDRADTDSTSPSPASSTLLAVGTGGVAISLWDVAGQAQVGA